MWETEVEYAELEVMQTSYLRVSLYTRVQVLFLTTRI